MEKKEQNKKNTKLTQSGDMGLMKSLVSGIRPEGTPKVLIPETDEVNKIEDEKTLFFDLENIFEVASERAETTKSVLYVDDDVLDVFRLLKRTKKVNISNLASMILESWILENNDKISEITKFKNKYIKP